MSEGTTVGIGGLPPQLARVHMVGIGGAGMSGLARILLARGGQVSGSDAKNSRGILELRTRGARVQVGHDPSALDQIPGGPSVVVTTHAAIPKTNPELVAARSRGIPILLRPRVLAQLMEGDRTLLLAGTHGKTSTTSMAVVALQHAGSDPSFAIGGELNESGTNAHHGGDPVFVAEADESDGSLLEYTPDVVVVTNIDADHLDFFGSIEAYVEVFDKFTERIRTGGTLVVCLDDPGSAALAGRVSDALAARGVTTVGYGRGTHAGLAPGVPNVATLLSWAPRGTGGAARVRFTTPVTGPADEAGTVVERELVLPLPGEHMALNAIAAVIGAVRVTGADTDFVSDTDTDFVGALDRVLAGIGAFGGVHRRFEFRGRRGGVEVIDDYAHHPTEVRSVLSAAQAMMAARVGPDAPRGRVIAVFQPHLYSRTLEFADEFAAALDLADTVVVADVYGAREAPIPGVSGRTIADQLTSPSVFAPDLSRLAGQVAELARPGDIVLTLGAGDITMQGPEILAALGGSTGTDAVHENGEGSGNGDLTGVP
ncbi:UDP-N-acetylmuramate--L-alanine ligase [Gordonia amicalis]|uniref:UDP-N-acetylmuramate--L-alanine ligase n=1 Tax=Gordonia amicalis TaxID=89053 RepID=A0ABU4DAA5_9ACTN|nr:UDP-N-acetylmuramate--L-alanine ligase [Gordonia amicalis]MBA5849563.1 UDP-N-acetylmuramate--L-alanine ligase [Gordonia amicalis]MDV6306229.1 UDP-N-acetylmuramate--L-alanine ligase [Gordonia amicalis]MDV7098965.1 UDP-N-acetylmuramate--L-alanine ligase [Gordonia amicalis]MDV7172065.1 UDP-N-acetylmuramate--L-alanine ligase [Gordonia amicalis]NKX76904.1 UDP-N-acetylmuramate--L-alanine ligase [Gordonia amicalis]